MSTQDSIRNIRVTERLPNFLVVGAAKCGTTSLYGYLIQHPDIFIPDVKECRFFSDIGERVENPFDHTRHAEIPKDIEAYKALFAGAKQELIGDVSPDYLFYYDNSIRNILETLGPATKIIIMLRDPVRRAFSNYMHLRREHLTSLDIERYLEEEDNFPTSETWWGFKIKLGGLYCNAVRAYMAAFRNVRVIVFEEFIHDPIRHVRDVLEFLGANSNINIKKPYFTNKTGALRFRWLDVLMGKSWPGKALLQRIMTAILGDSTFRSLVWIVREKNLRSKEPAKYVETLLNRYYACDVECTEQLLGRRLPWLRGRNGGAVN